MSEYQYYEFQAVDRPLNPEQMTELRSLSKRAQITPTRLQNVYHFGSFGGDPEKLMERYFDAFVYVANWGTHRFMLRLPRRLLDSKAVWPYAVDGALDFSTSGDFIVLEFLSDDEAGGHWIDDEEAAAWMPALLPVRADLAAGDRRALYLAWLAAVEAKLREDDDVEPPVPPGLGRLSASLETLADFLRVDEDLLAIGAERSQTLAAELSSGELERWILAQPVADKDNWLIRLATGDDAHVRTEIIRQFRQATAPPVDAAAGERTVAALLAAAAERAEARRREEARRTAAEQARREREAAIARASYLEGLAGREEELWRQVEPLIETKRPKDYDLAVQLLKDLHDLADRQQRPDTFAARFAPLRARYAKRSSLLERLGRAGLTA